MSSVIPIHFSQRFEAKSLLMIAVRDRIDQLGMPQKELASAAKVRQPRISSLINGEIDKFSIDSLTDIAESLGLVVSLTVAPAIKPS